ncbi:roadblock/LC7 domain-containing protein [Actinocorallia libanotica]|uniref:Roadblock/LAMTOR2 domain-containing protein n=1 Tax=Actinocorallia libanotica TaxID=46162 RepID=A0ABN1RFK6_9ACTN
MKRDTEPPTQLGEFFAQLSVAGVRHAVLLGADGLLIGRSSQTEQDVGERMAAACSGLYALGMSAAPAQEWQPVQQVLVDFSEGFLLTRSVDKLVRLAVLTDGDADLATIAELAEHLTIRFRPVLSLLS